MFRSTLFWRLYVGCVVLILLTATVVGVLIARRVEADFLEETRRALHYRALMFREMAVPLLSAPSTGESLQKKVERIGRDTGTRFTLIGADGTVLADSNEDPARMDDHFSRPEVVQAREHGVGISTRFSNTLRTRMMYLALPLEVGGGGGFVRTALELREIDRRQKSIRSSMLIGVGVAALAALFLGIFVARRFSRPLVAMSQAARSIAAGDFEKRLEIHERDETGVLAQSFNLMAGHVQQRIETITEERNQLLTILRGMVEGVVAVDPSERILLMNSVAGQVLGADPDGCVGRRLGGATRVHEIVEVVSQTIRTGVQRQREMLLPAHPQDRVFEVHSAPIRTGGGELAGAVAVLHDVTELRRLEEVRRDFVANASHEMKTPITVVRGIVETLLEDREMPTETRERFLQRIHAQATRLSAIVSDLLDLARVESSPEAVPRQELDLREPLRESFRALSAAADSRNVDLSIEAPSEPLPILGEWTSLRLVFDNLLDNAVKYTPPGGTVRARLSRNGDNALLEVVDTGIGIEERDRERIFERFYRVDKARSRELGGTGLGLSIVRNLVRAHRGEVFVESKPGKGSTFRIWLPIHQSAN